NIVAQSLDCAAQSKACATYNIVAQSKDCAAQAEACAADNIVAQSLDCAAQAEACATCLGLECKARFARLTTTDT
ncbi:hypothetical protein QUF58_14095, partial [Anaerolineales bacterium HSG24]|nr:hypothetical protein [Anaerolineales bacterium HSG24]